MLEQATQTPRDVRRFMRMIDHLSRADIGAVIDASIAALDARDGDIDMEDSEAGESAVDRCGRYFGADGDKPWSTADDEVAWPEWHLRPRAIVFESVSEASGPFCMMSEDCEASGDDEAGEDAL